jgi:hypothetical protein
MSKEIVGRFCETPEWITEQMASDTDALQRDSDA